MKFILTSISALMVVAISLALKFTPKNKESLVESEWFNFENYSIYFRKNNQYSLWRRNGDELKYLGCGEWNLKNDFFKIKDVPNMKVDLGGDYNFHPIPSSSYPITFLVCEKKDIWFVMKD